MSSRYDQESENTRAVCIELEERRSEPDLSQIWNLLRSIDKKVDLHLEEENQLRPKLLSLISVLEMSKGALVFIKWTAAVVVALAAVYAWITSHFTYKL